MFEIVDSEISLDVLARYVGTAEAGAIATFAGTTRAENRGRKVLRLEYEAYASMAVSEFEKIAEEARGRWEICRVAIVHRVGVVPLGEISVAIAVPTGPSRAPITTSGSAAVPVGPPATSASPVRRTIRSVIGASRAGV